MDGQPIAGGAPAPWSAQENAEFLSRNGLESPADLPVMDPARLEQLDWGGGPPTADQLASALAYKRLHNLGADGATASKLIEAGITSAAQIASLSPDTFTRDYAGKLGLADGDLNTMHDAAVQIQNRTLHMAASAQVVAEPHFRTMQAAAVGVDIVKYFEALPSFQEMFETLAFCDCEECDTIFGPAAYLVDLLRIVDVYVTRANPGLDPMLTLDARRPDLAAIPLTCEMTTETLPYLEVVDERLRAAAQTLLGAGTSVDLAMATTLVSSVELPHNAGLVRIRELLAALGLSLPDVYSAWGAGAAATLQEELGLSAEQFNIVTTVRSADGDVAPFYDVPAEALGTLAHLDKFMARTGLDADAVADLVDQGLEGDAAAGIRKTLWVNQGAEDRPVALGDSDSGSVIENLDAAALDRLDRLRRLSAATGWAPSLTDWLLRAVSPGPAPAIDEPTLEQLARVRRIAERFAVTPLEASTFVGPIKTYGTEDGEGQSAFDAHFNSAATIAAGTTAYRPAPNPYNPAFTDPPLDWSADALDLHLRLAPGLDLPVASVAALGTALFGAEATQLTVPALSALHRHALLSRCLGLPIGSYLELLALFGLSGRLVFEGPDLDALIVRWEWMTAAGIDIDTLRYVATGDETSRVGSLLDSAAVAAWLPTLTGAVDRGAEDAEQRLDAQIAILLGVAPELVPPARALATYTAGMTGPTWLDAFLAPADATAAEGLLRLIARWIVFARTASVPADVLAVAAANPSAFDVPASGVALPVDSLEHVQRLATIAAEAGDRRPDILRSVAAVGSTDAVQALDDALGWTAEDTADLLAHELGQVANPIEQLWWLRRALRQASALGTSIGLMRALAQLAGEPADGGKHEELARRLEHQVSTRYGAAAWPARKAKIDTAVRQWTHPALLAVVRAGIRHEYADLEAPEHLSDFLLIDVESGPEAEISYVREALNAVQLYLQRCRLRLEPGVDKLDIPESWWTWLLNYRRWDANRRIFLYPENYLLPELRRDGTKLFAELSDELLQDELTADAVEGAFTAYLDELLVLSEVKPVDALAHVIATPQGPKRATWILGRSATAAGTYFLCRRLEGQGWSEWEKVDLTIRAEHVTPVYAFDRLFLFWVKLDAHRSPAVASGGGQTTMATSTVWRATIQYSFQRRNGGWVEPQTLDSDSVVAFEGDGNESQLPLAGDSAFAGAFDMTRIEWLKVMAVQVPGPALADGTRDSTGERLVVVHGPFTEPDGTTVDPLTVTLPSNPDAAALVRSLRERADAQARLAASSADGRLPVRRPFVLDSTLGPNSLSREGELLVFDPSFSQFSSSGQQPELNSIDGTLLTVSAYEPIVDRYRADGSPPSDLPTSSPGSVSADDIIRIVGGQGEQTYRNLLSPVDDQNGNVLSYDSQVIPGNISPLKVAQAIMGLPQPRQSIDPILRLLRERAGANVLLATVDGPRAAVTSVKNSPGEVLFNAGDEVFLLESQRPGGLLSDSLSVSDSPLSPWSFYTLAGMGGNPSQDAFALWYGFSWLAGVRPEDIESSFESAMQSVKDQYSSIAEWLDAHRVDLLRVIRGAPIVLPGAFLDIPRVDANVARTLVDRLRAAGVLDGAGRVISEALTREAVVTVLGGIPPAVAPARPFDKREATAVYRALVTAPRPVSVSYTGQVDWIQYQATRLTTRAVPRLERALFTGGLDGLLALRSQAAPGPPALPFDRLTPSISAPAARDGAQVDFDGLYGRYFWELFFHGPVLVANALAGAQQFQDALSWFHYVFDPTVRDAGLTADALDIGGWGGQVLQQLQQQPLYGQSTYVDAAGAVSPWFNEVTDLSFLAATGLSPAQIATVRERLLEAKVASPASRFWRFRPFRTQTLAQLADTLVDPAAIQAYENDPFDPFAIARQRIGAFEKATVMQYVETLLAWGDYYFAQDTWESITAASMVYEYAANLLGPRPRRTTRPKPREATTYAAIRARYDAGMAVPEFLIHLEATLPPAMAATVAPIPIQTHAFNDLGTYFAVPENPQLTGYWDRVADRQYKIRHSLDIAGHPRSLALFEPPLDPLALIRAAGATNDVLAQAAAGTMKTPPLRFRVALERAKALAATVAQLGASALATLERRDAEELALLQSSQQAEVLALMVDTKEQSVAEAEATLASLQASRAAVQSRVDFYTGVLDKGLLAGEQTHLVSSAAAMVAHVASGGLAMASAIGYSVAQAGSPFALTYGGEQIGSSLQAAAGGAQAAGTVADFVAQRSLTMAGYQRRDQDWTLQQQIAQSDLDTIDAQIAAAEARLGAAKRDVATTSREVAQNKHLDDFMRGKFTSAELFGWMAGRVSVLHYQTYLLALEAATMAQAALQFEFGTDEQFLAVELWSGGRKGQLAGEALTLALDRMEAAEARQDAAPLGRPLEIDRVISLAQLDPAAFASLKQTGTCDFDLPELLFDYDFPGHYQRRIKAVSLSIPAVVGPYQSLKAVLTQTRNRVALQPTKEAVEALIAGQDTADIRTDWAPGQQIAISRAVEESGMFVLDFHDERYMPFEGTGAVSSWRLDLPPETNQIDFNQLSDVIMTLHYTARSDGGLQRSVREEVLPGNPLRVHYYVDLPRAFPLEWQAFTSTAEGSTARTLSFQWSPSWQGAPRALELDELVLLLRPAGQGVPAGIGTLKIGATQIALDATDGVVTLTQLGLKQDALGDEWQLTLTGAQVDRIELLVSYVARAS
jgi:hypothetical protein